MWGATGWTRMFDAEIGGQVAWLLPAALILLVAGLVADPAARRGPTGPGPRCCSGAAGCSSPGWSFSFMAGHLPRLLHRRPGAGDRRAGRHRRGAAVAARRGLVGRAGAGRRRVAVTAVWSYVLLDRSADFAALAARRWCWSAAWPSALGAAAGRRVGCRGRVAAVAGRGRR